MKRWAHLHGYLQRTTQLRTLVIDALSVSKFSQCRSRWPRRRQRAFRPLFPYQKFVTYRLHLVDNALTWKYLHFSFTIYNCRGCLASVSILSRNEVFWFLLDTERYLWAVVSVVHWTWRMPEHYCGSVKNIITFTEQNRQFLTTRIMSIKSFHWN